jgi:PPK2 family polyphosphate:nucleotide phosphotransferase
VSVDELAIEVPPAPGPVSEALRLSSDLAPVTLDGFDASVTPGIDGRAEAESALVDDLGPRLWDLHDRLMAAEQHAVLVVLQGLDGSGKSGTVKHVGGLVNPAGITVASFKEPEGKEKYEPFLARIRRQLPDHGRIGFFDRSYVEDAIVPRVENGLDDRALTRRLAQIRRFEDDLRLAGVLVIKCFLHLSYDEQRERFLRRLRRPDKQWKFSESDVETRAKWPHYQAVYGEVIGRTSTEADPWFVVPSDHKWYRNWAVASILLEHLERLDPQYPTAGVDIDEMRRRLEPPN